MNSYKGINREEEEQHLAYCVEVVQKNVDYYQKKADIMGAKIKEMYDNYRSANPELHNELVIEIGMREQIVAALKKNKMALEKPYFGRVDYQDKEDKVSHTFYLGKNAVMKDTTEVLVVDWRAPVSSIYYESQVGESSYQVPEQKRRDIILDRKRTYEIEKGHLIEYYDAEVVANDELLTKYLAKNKEAVLGEIIATIQKEQNDIIRETPFRNSIVQGVAGSGKTTVAMHRISYILYNYKDKFRPEEFFIIGSNRMLLNYITGVLPDLDVYHVNQMVMEEFLTRFLERDFDEKKYKVRYQKIEKEEEENREFQVYKGSLAWLEALEEYCKKLEDEMISKDTIIYKEKEIFPKEAIQQFLENNKNFSVQDKINMLNKRLVIKIKDYNKQLDETSEVIKQEKKKFQNYFGEKNFKKSLLEIYKQFVCYLQERQTGYQEGLELLQRRLEKKELDVYDLAALLFLKRYLKMTEEIDEVKHIVIDEAQDFGVLIFGILKKILPKATFTIMGDISQNINYNSGMNDWEALRNFVFSPERDYFHILSKSYRNTIEISQYAGKILEHCSFQTYEIQPIIRHGKEPKEVECFSKKELLAKSIEQIEIWQKQKYDTIAVICKNQEEAIKVQKELSDYIEVEEGNLEDMTFTRGVMVLPVYLTKGLEFDTVLLWNPIEQQYKTGDANAKLLYVAATRALHELSVFYMGEITKLLQ